jgi:ribosomal protein L7/L12
MNIITSPKSTMNIAANPDGTFRVEMQMQLVVDVPADQIMGFVKAHDTIRDSVLKVTREVSDAVHQVNRERLLASLRANVNYNAETIMEVVEDAEKTFGRLERLKMVKYVKETLGLSLKEAKDAIDIVFPFVQQ